MKAISILIVIATYNRPKSFIKALRSIDDQDYLNFSIYISDNSPNNDTENVMKNMNLRHKYTYIHREPQPNGIVHFNLILEEMPSGYDYYMICHDDDTLRPDAITSIVALAEQHPECVAICSNGYKAKEDGERIGFFIKPNGNRIISSKKELGLLYLKEMGLPFPAIFYKSETLKIPFDEKKGGKYCDTAHTLDLLDLGPVYWASDYLIINYTVSPSQDSSVIEPYQRGLLLKYVSRVCGFDIHMNVIEKFRIKDVYSYYSSNKKRFGRKILLIFIRSGHFSFLLKSLLKNLLLV